MRQLTILQTLHEALVFVCIFDQEFISVGRDSLLKGYNSVLKMRVLCQILLARSAYRCELNILRNISHSKDFKLKDDPSENTLEENPPDIVQLAQDKNILYSSHLASKGIRVDLLSRRNFTEKYQRLSLEQRKKNSVPLIVKKLLPRKDFEKVEREDTDYEERESRVTLPYTEVENIRAEKLNSNLKAVEEYDWGNFKDTVSDDIANRMQAYEKNLLESVKTQERDTSRMRAEGTHSRSVMKDGLCIDDVLEYGTCDQFIPVSKVPCGGCGALLHCQDYALPGFIPKELFEILDPGELRSVTCQRCYFLKHHNTALNIRVSPDVYQTLLEPIKEKKALAVVVVDLLDVPCSIWPNLIDILGTRRPVVVVGNKVDLLPADDVNHLQRIKESLKAVIDQTSLGRCNIVHIALTSAITGFGIESLITKIQTSWGVKGDIYLVGCTNSGKSTLFNALLGSDMCKTKASFLIHRATTSPWPGTTLNMLKFPLLRTSHSRLYERRQRLTEQNVKFKRVKEYTSDVGLATLAGYIGRTFADEKHEEKMDQFSLDANKLPRNSIKILGINESHPDYIASKWCYDTPGTVQPDQMINLLTHEELMKVLPRQLIRPQTFSLTSGKTLFIGGLARFDVLYCASSVRITVFSAPKIPITIVKTVYASLFYSKYLGTPVLGVPVGGEERLQHWPTLAPHDLKMMSNNSQECCGDVVLSSAGWVAVNAKEGLAIDVRGWTPGGRGIYQRTPSMLPRIINLKGRRLKSSPVYKPHKLLIPKSNEV
ncbi:nitric oxide-associated protein 1-like isoform X2 [Macrobrachium nipponense]|uniref:nitric oxide-associated protein 1-like isoform X2 n=1 Tax=Macrobrachium nipponense TaxID=159736 RepID=UPI0030C87538